MNRTLFPLLVVGLMSLVWWTLFSGGEPRSSGPADASLAPDASAAAYRAPLAPLVVSPEASPDADVAADALPPQVRVDRFGMLGQDVAWIEHRMNPRDWKPVDDPDGPSFVGHGGTRVTWLVEGGVVVGGRAHFTPRALSADLKGQSNVFVGNHSAIELHWEEYVVPTEPERSGVIELPDGRKFRYHGRLRVDGEPPYGPEFMELRPVP